MIRSVSPLLIIILCLCCLGCNVRSENSVTSSIIEASNEECSGAYEGPEFKYGSDKAHQFSNKMSEAVGDRLKQLYNNRMYSKVDFSKIEMSTEGMGTNRVTYTLVIPFMRVENRCDAMTSFDHSGGWDHTPALGSKKNNSKAHC